jgi:hypothetical protein
VGGALEFDGEKNYIDCGNQPEFDCTDSMTVAAWVKVRKFDKKFQAIVTKGDTAWRLQRLEEEGKVCFSVGAPKYVAGTNSTVRVNSKRKVDDGQWHHVVGLFDGHRVAIYLDGELENSLEASQLPSNSAPVWIGENSMTRGRLFNGWLDDVRLYGYALSAEEIQALYKSADTQRAGK